MTTLSEINPHANVFTQTGALRFALGMALSALSGIMLLLAFPPYGVWPLAWVALVPYLFAQYRLIPLRWSSLAAATANLLWLGPFMARLFGANMGPFFQYLGVWLAILSFFLSRERKFHELTQFRWFILSGVLAWVGFEMIRATFIPLVATSAFIGYTQAAQAWLIQPVSVFSVYGLNLVIMLVNFTLAQSVMVWADKHWIAAGVPAINTRSTWRWLALAGGVTAAWVCLSLAQYFSTPQDAPTVRVAALTPNFPREAHNDKETPVEVRVSTFAEMARQAAQQGAQIIYTAEMIFAFDPQVEYTEELKAVARETGAYLFLTYVISQEGQPWRNEAIMLSPSGEFSEVYGKNHVIGEPPTMMSGVYPVFETPLGRLASLICHDANYTDVTRKLARNGAQLIATPFNEFGGFGEQLWTNVVFRAVESGAAMVISGAKTVSGIVEGNGRVVELEINLGGKRQVVVGDVHLGRANTLYLILGDWMGWICLGGFVFFMVFQMVTENKAKKADRA